MSDATNPPVGGQVPDPEVLKQLFPDSATGMVKLCLSMLLGTAWQFLGLAVHPRHGKVVKDLAQARLAIDCGAALIELVKSHLPEAEIKELERALNDLRANFVSQTQIPEA